MSVVCLKSYEIRQNVSKPSIFLRAIKYTFRFRTMPNILQYRILWLRPGKYISIFLRRYVFLRYGCRGMFLCNYRGRYMKIKVSFPTPYFKLKFGTYIHVELQCFKKINDRISYRDSINTLTTMIFSTKFNPTF
jgi:hypothetical protein